MMLDKYHKIVADVGSFRQSQTFLIEPHGTWAQIMTEMYGEMFYRII
jgi:hypothetical protein